MKSCSFLQKAIYASPLGEMLMVGRGNELHGLWFIGQNHFPKNHEQWEDAPKEAPFVIATFQWLDNYFSGRYISPSSDLKFQGTPFMQAVWQELLLIPYGTTTTYTYIAQRTALRLGRAYPAIRAVSTAIGRNPISLIVPCHRVLGSDGRMCGYAGGLERKITLLTLEKTTLC